MDSEINNMFIFAQLTRFLKYDKHVTLKTAEMVYSAEV